MAETRLTDEERQAVVDLAQMVAAIAERCWENLGTETVKRITDGAFKVATTFGYGETN